MKFSIANAHKSCEDLKKFYGVYADFLTKYASHLLLLLLRISVGLVFLKSGLTKIANVDNTIILFEYEYELPLISPIVGAYSSIFAELVFGSAVIAGFVTRLSVVPLIIMTLIIQLLVVQNPEHFTWLFQLCTLAIYGGGILSVDGVLCKFLCKNKKK
ncbi:MAG: DoxX family protein [Rickettsiales bacterium]|nr:DoxX family protein [Rickettsiales bacterium]